MCRQRFLVVGGGFFGLYLSEFLALNGHAVLLCEREPDFMRRASHNNQARVHNGYHYPRSVLTALRSRVSFPRFVAEFRDCVVSDFHSFYLIGSKLGKVTPAQFAKFCERIGAPYEVAPNWLRSLTNPNFIEACFSDVEYAFNADALRSVMHRRIEAAGVEWRLETTVEKVRIERHRLAATVRSADGSTEDVVADQIFNCAYSNINHLLTSSALPAIALKHEMTEMCIVQVPEALQNVGITVMCGPFFSVMPFPPLGRHSFSHVRYTPHYECFEGPGGDPTRLWTAKPSASSWEFMRRDAARHMPILGDCRHEDSLWEVKTVLPRSETDDSRPILFRLNHGLAGLHSILGGKIDNVYDVIEVIQAQGIVRRTGSAQS